MSNIAKAYVCPENAGLVAGVLNADYSYCKYFLRCEQAATDDQINNLAVGNVAAPRNTGANPVAAATIWANPGFVTVGSDAATLGQYCSLPAAASRLTLNGYSLCLVMRIKKTVAAVSADQTFLASTDLNATPAGGIRCYAVSTGRRWRLGFMAADLTAQSLYASVDSVTDGSTAPLRTLVALLPRNATSGYLGMDGLANYSVSFASLAGKSLDGGGPLYIGSQVNTGIASQEFQIAQLAAYQFPADMPAAGARDSIFEWAHRNPGSPIPNKLFIPA